ncbi:MAG: hypothetical protein ACI4ON_00350 [Clostridia bacterium]
MKEQKIPSKIRSLLISKLKDYRWMGQELIDIEEELDSTPSDDNRNIKSKNKISKRTESMAIKLAENEKYQEIKKWKSCIENLFISYDKNSLKWKFIQRRYILCDTVIYKWRGTLKDNDIYKDFELEGIDKSIRTFLRLKEDILDDLYKEAKKNNLINL